MSNHFGKVLVTGNLYRVVPLEPLEILMFVGQFDLLGRVDQLGQPVDDRFVVPFDFVVEGAGLIFENPEITFLVAEMEQTTVEKLVL